MLTAMKMVMIVFRNSLEADILRLLKRLRMKAFTDVPKVLGVGEAGTAMSSFIWPGANAIIFVVLEDADAARLVCQLEAFHFRASEKQHGAKIPLRVFVLPCEQAI